MEQDRRPEHVGGQIGRLGGGVGGVQVAKVELGGVELLRVTYPERERQPCMLEYLPGHASSPVACSPRGEDPDYARSLR